MFVVSGFIDVSMYIVIRTTRQKAWCGAFLIGNWPG